VDKQREKERQFLPHQENKKISIWNLLSPLTKNKRYLWTYFVNWSYTEKFERVCWIRTWVCQCKFSLFLFDDGVLLLSLLIFFYKNCSTFCWFETKIFRIRFATPKSSTKW
jgi:hypothetical protein